MSIENQICRYDGSNLFKKIGSVYLYIATGFILAASVFYGCKKDPVAPELPDPTASISASLKDNVDIYYSSYFENAKSVQLDIFRDDTKIISKEISASGYSEVLSYVSNQEITKGKYEFVATVEGVNGTVTSEKANTEIPNYDPQADWSSLDISFVEDSSTIVILPVPTDMNPEDNPVGYLPESFEADENVTFEFNPEDNSLSIIGTEDMFGEYEIHAEIGSSEGGIIPVSRKGTIYKLARMSGFIESNESHEGILATVIPYEVVGNDTIRLYSKKADDEGRNFTDNSGYFEFKLNKKSSDLEEIILMARQGTPENYEGWVRVESIPSEKFEDILVRAVPYGDYEGRKDEFKSFVLETTRFSEPFPYLGTRFDFDGSILRGLQGYEDYVGLKKIRILDSDPFTGGTFTLEEQEVFKQKLLDKENIGGIIGNYEIKPEQIVFGNDETHTDYTWNENVEPAYVNPSQGIIVVVPRNDLFATGVSYSSGPGPIVSRGTVYLKAGRYGVTTFPHEMGHLFISASHPESLYGETMMSSPFPSEFGGPGPADVKLGYIVYENSFLIKPNGSLYARPDYIKNILRDDFK